MISTPMLPITCPLAFVGSLWFAVGQANGTVIDEASRIVATTANNLPDADPDIRALWDYDRPAESEQRFRAALAAAQGEFRLELLTQIARTLSLRQRYAEAHQLLDQIEPQLKAAGSAARLRYLLERGRTFRSAGEPDRARPLFVRAWELGEIAGNEDLAIDALHMIAIVDGGEHGIEWNLKALPLARAAKDPQARRWAASLLNNLGWESRQLGRHQQALQYFRESIVAYEARGEPATVRIARWQVARTLRDLGRHDEALTALYQLEAELAAAELTDGYVFEEIAENLEAQGKSAVARPYFARAYQLLAADSSLARDEPQRLARLNEKSQPKSQAQ